MREGGGVDWKERGRRVRNPCVALFQEEAHLSSFRFICLAWLAERRGETTTNAAWRSHLLAVFPDLVEREKGKGASRSICVRAVRVPEERAFMAAAYVSALRRHRPSRSRNMFLFATLRRAPLGLTSGPFFCHRDGPVHDERCLPFLPRMPPTDSI